MSKSSKLLAVGALVFLKMGQAQYAHSATLPVQEINNIANTSVGSGTNTDTFAVDGLQFTVSGCSASGISSCSAADIEVAFDGSQRGSPTIEFLNNNNSSAALSASVAEDVAFTLTIAPVASGKTGYEKGTVVSSISNAITGTQPKGTVFADVTCVNTSICGTNPVNATVSAASSAISFAATSQSISLNINLGLSGNNGTTLTLATDALHFSPAPEPASIALFASGLAGLVTIRRRFKRQPLAST